jgi:uncharacterized protein YdbL (DUF1318 family)
MRFAEFRMVSERELLRRKMMRLRRLNFLTVLMCAALTAALAFADAKAQAHARRKARWSSVAELLKADEATEGENGYLVPGKSLDEKKKAVVADENRDRKTGYEAIAEENNTSVEAIAKAAGRINRKKAEDLKKK